MADDVFQKVAERLRAPTEEGRRDAVLELLKLRDRRAIDLLAKLVEIDTSVEVRFNARKAYYLLIDAHPENPSEPYLPMPDGISLDDLEKLLLDENQRIRTQAIQLAGKLDPGSVAPTLRTVIAVEKNPKLLGSLLLALGQARLKYDIPTIASFLAAPEPWMRSIAIEALRMIGEQDAFECIVPLLRDPDSEVRANATKALPDLDGGEMLNILRSMAMSPSEAFRDAAIFSLQRFKAPVAAKVLGHLAAVDPVIPLREKARAGLEAMAKSDENARKVLEQLNTPEEPEDPNAPAMVPLDGIWETVHHEPTTVAGSTAGPGATTPGAGAEPGSAPVPGAAPGPDPAAGPGAPTAPAAPSGPPPKPRYMLVPGVTKKLVKEICLGDQALRENGLKQLAAILKPEHVPFLLLQLDREKDPRISSHILTLIGKTRSHQAYAAVIKRFKDVDNRVKSNAIEAAMMIDPNTTPDRIAAFLNDPNNRVRANTILASATRPNFDPLVFVRDLSAFRDAAYRRSALFVIDRLKHPSFIALLEYLVYDDDMEVRHMAFKLIQEYAGRGDKKAKQLAEAAGKLLAKEQKPAGMSEQDFHASMIAMRAPTGPKKSVRKNAKSTSEEFGEQLLGTDGLKKAGQTMKNLQDQAKMAREKAAARLSQTGASLAAVDWQEKLLGLGKFLVVIVFLILHVIRTVSYFRLDSPFRLISLAATLLAAGLGTLLMLLRKPGAAGILVFFLFGMPFAASWFNLQDSDIIGGQRVAMHSGGTTIASSSHIASKSVAIPPKTAPGKTASATQSVKNAGSPNGRPGQPEAAAVSVQLLAPTKGTQILGTFDIKAKAAGKVKSVELLIDNTSLKTFPVTKDGVYELAGVKSEDHPAGRHAIKTRVTDTSGRRLEDLVFVEFMSSLPRITISSPASGAVFWRDDQFVAGIPGQEYDHIEFLLDDVLISAFPPDPMGRYEYAVPIATLTEGKHLFTVRAPLTDGRVASHSVTFRALIPKPTVRFLVPKSDEEVFGTVDLTLEANSGWKETAIRKVTWFADGMEKKALASPPWQDSWETVDLEPGPHELKAVIENELDNASETVIRVNVIQPKFAVSVKGFRSGQELTADTQGFIDVMNDCPGTKIEKVVLTIDDKPFQELANHPYGFTIKAIGHPTGSRRLTAEAIRSDGKTCKASIPFSVNPRNSRSVLMSALDASGKSLPAKSLEKVKLELKVDGMAVSGLSQQSAEAVPLHFGFLIDVSASMKADQKLDKAKEALSAFIDGMKPLDRAFLLKFSDAPELVVEFTEDKPKLQQELEYLTPQQGAALFDAAFKGAEACAGNRETTILILLADSGDESVDGKGPISKHSQAEVAEILRRGDVQVYVVGLGSPSQSSGAKADLDLRALAKNSGGKFLSAPTAAELPALFGSILREVRNQTKLSYLSPAGPPDGKWHTLELSAPDSKDLKLIYKPGYQAK